MKNIAYLIVALFAVVGCSRESDLRKSIFIPDPDDARLPAYTEWGYNTFGAYLNEEAFTNEQVSKPVTIYASSTSTEFRFEGYLGENYFDKNGKTTVLSIKTTALTLKAIEEIESLNGKSISLSDPAVAVTVYDDGSTQPLRITSGKMTFNRVQKVLIDKKYSQMIISGYFELAGDRSNGSRVILSDGRFDVGVKDYYNFITLK